MNIKEQNIHIWAGLALVPFAHPAIAADDFHGASFYYGDIHVHTGVSGDGTSEDMGRLCFPENRGPCGSITNVVETAKKNALDFISITDHVNGNVSASQAELFHEVQQLLMNKNEPENGFITLPATELWFQQHSGSMIFGHKNMYFFGDNETLSSLTLDVAQFNEEDGTSAQVPDCDAIWTFVQEMEDLFGDILLIPHHPAGHGVLNTHWACHNTPHSPSVEVYSQHGNSMQSYPSFDPLTAPGSYEDGGAVDDAIHPAIYGYKLGFFGSSDNHSTIPGGVCSLDNTDWGMGYGAGIAIVMLDSATPFTRKSIYSALTNRKTYASSGPMLPVTVTYAVEGEVYGEMGDIIDIPYGTTVDMTLRIPEDYEPHIVRVSTRQPDMTGGEKGLWFETEMSFSGNGTWEASFNNVPPLVYPTIQIDGDSWYGKGNCDDGGEDSLEMVWVTPSWFNVIPTVGGTDNPNTDQDTQTTDETAVAGETGVTEETAADQTSETDQVKPSEGCGGCNANKLPLPLTYLLLCVPLSIIRRRAKTANQD